MQVLCKTECSTPLLCSSIFPAQALSIGIIFLKTTPKIEKPMTFQLKYFRNLV